MYSLSIPKVVSLITAPTLNTRFEEQIRVTNWRKRGSNKLPSIFNFTFLFTPNRKHYSTRFEGFGWTTNTDSTQKKMLYLHMRNKLLLVFFFVTNSFWPLCRENKNQVMKPFAHLLQLIFQNSCRTLPSNKADWTIVPYI